MAAIAAEVFDHGAPPSRLAVRIFVGLSDAHPETRYTKSGDVSIAYQVVGEGPFDLLYVPGWISNIELMWEEPRQERLLRRLAAFSRLITFDKRGTGLSDRVSVDALPTLEQRMDDVRAVLDAAGSERAALFGFSEGGLMCVLYAATYPERTRALATYGIYAKRRWSPDYPWAPNPEEREREIATLESSWGDEMDLGQIAPTMTPAERKQIATYFRRSASPGAAAALLRMNTEIDVRHVLPVVHVPTLVIHRAGDLDVHVDEGRWIAAQIPDSRYVELPGEDHLAWAGDIDEVIDEVEEFLTGVRRGPGVERVLATVLFTDIVGSTERAAEMGDRAWASLVAAHHAAVRRQLERFRGEELDTAGDGFFAAFDGPARAIRCALAIRGTVRALGLDVRAGVHTGECERLEGKLAGIAVSTGARIGAKAAPGEVLVSSTVTDLVAGSGLAFDDRGEYELKGIPGVRRLYAVAEP